VSTDKCTYGPGTIVYDFSGLDLDPTSCNTDNPIPAGIGAKSLTIGPIIMTESGCKPVTTLPPKSGAAAWKMFARACGPEVPPCLDPGALCISTALPTPGYSQCIYRHGEHECPSEYPNRRFFYDEVSDSRYCSECWCGAPEGGECTAYVKAYLEATCTGLSEGRVASSKADPVCGDTLTDYPLGSKTVTAPVYEPGWCEPSGGEALGAVELIGPSTFCCQ
jgi:hypothetical protein